MNEETVTASHFRVHFKEIANALCAGGEPVRVSRHGLEMVALVSLRHLDLIEKAMANEPARPPEPETIDLSDPYHMPLPLVVEAYEFTHETTDFNVISWRYKAYFAIKARTGKFPPRKVFPQVPGD